MTHNNSSIVSSEKASPSACTTYLHLSPHIYSLDTSLKMESQIIIIISYIIEEDNDTTSKKTTLLPKNSSCIEEQWPTVESNGPTSLLASVNGIYDSTPWSTWLSTRTTFSSHEGRTLYQEIVPFFIKLWEYRVERIISSTFQPRLMLELFSCKRGCPGTLFHS